MLKLGPIPVALLGSGALIGMSLLIARAVRLDLIDGDAGNRTMGVILGALLMVMGNFLPKRIKQLSDDDCEPSRCQPYRRFAGWTFVLAGIGYAGAWLVAPIEHAGTLAMSICATAVLLVVGTCIRSVRARRST